MTNRQQHKLILASSSPYRKILLERLGRPFQVIKPDCDEDSFKNKISDPQRLAETLAYEKAKSVFEQLLVDKTENSIVIGSDQLVSFSNQILNKPHTHEKAVEQLKKLSGQTHLLITSVCLLTHKQKQVWTHQTALKMRPLSSSEIEKYLKTDQPYDCAGSYKIEKTAITLFSQIDSSDWTAIEGLPLIELNQRLLKVFDSEQEF